MHRSSVPNRARHSARAGSMACGRPAAGGTGREAARRLPRWPDFIRPSFLPPPPGGGYHPTSFKISRSKRLTPAHGAWLFATSRPAPKHQNHSAELLVSRREALADVPGLLDLVHDGDGEVLAADLALALVVLEQVVAAQAELAGALAGLNRGGRRDRRPVEVGDL